MWILKIFMVLWPFIREMVIGDKTVHEILKNNKSKVYFIILTAILLWFIFVVTTKLYYTKKLHEEEELREIEIMKNCESSKDYIETKKEPIKQPLPEVKQHNNAKNVFEEIIKKEKK